MRVHNQSNRDVVTYNRLLSIKSWRVNTHGLVMFGSKTYLHYDDVMNKKAFKYRAPPDMGKLLVVDRLG